ncbi:MAG: cobalamin-binding protein [Gammaproteobacteria bacterium]|nr:cobalamin-binding protein [Gammaproteobacteria bacterium]
MRLIRYLVASSHSGTSLSTNTFLYGNHQLTGTAWCRRSLVGLFCAILCFYSLVATAQPVAGNAISVTDYTGKPVSLSRPAERIVALSPHLVENIFSAGAGDRLVGVVAYSDYPPVVKQIQQIGSNNLLNFEAIVALQPDLIVGWQSGNTKHSLNRLKDLGFALYIDEPKHLQDIARSVRDIGVLAGTSASAEAAAARFLSSLRQLQYQHRNLTPVTVFYQVWNQPLQTINDQHVISAAIKLCGGQNIYADQAIIAPVVNIESIIDRDPQVIIASGVSEQRPDWLDDWLRWPQLTAVKNKHLFFVPANHLQRHTLRMLSGVAAICEQLQQVRQHALANEKSGQTD